MSVEPDGDVLGFARWLLSSQNPKPAPQTASIQPESLTDTAQGAILIARLHRIQRVLSKPIIKDLGFTKDMEFATLVQVALMDHPNKKELCRELLIENSTGVEITKRLAKRGYITERPDPNDRRSARLSLTEKGKRTLIQGYEKLAVVHTSFLDALDDKQKKEFVHQLTLINRYHSGQLNARPDLLS